MVSSIPLTRILTQQMMTSVFGLVALGLGFVFSLNQGNIIIIGFMALFTVLIALVLVNQIRISVHEASYM